jgi:uncharacterized RDD family membrane protein YckC
MSTPNPFSAPNAPVRDVFNQNATELATRGQRFGAALIDGIIGMLVTFPLLLAFFGFSYTSYGLWVAQNMFMATIVSFVLGIGIYLLLHGYLLHKNGQTIGKMLLKIKIVRKDGTVADFARIVLRRILPVMLIANIPYVGGLVLLVNYLLIFRASYFCGHDDIADTMVIKL